MLKIEFKYVFRGVVIGLGIILLLVALAIAGTRLAEQKRIQDENDKSENVINRDKPACGPGSESGVPCGGIVETKNTKIRYIINKEGIPDGSGGVYQKLTFDFDLGEEQASTTVFDALKNVADKNKFEIKYNNNYSFGVFIESIAGIKNGDGNKYWQYYVNSKLGDVAADKKEIKAGDVVEWKFERVPEF